MVIATGILGSLMIVPDLHGSDLCLFSAAAWIVWEEQESWRWRVSLAVAWLISTPYVNSTALAIRPNRWTLFELVLLIAVAIAARWPVRQDVRGLASASGS